LLDPLHVRVEFGAGVPHEIQGPALLAFERTLREMSKSVAPERLWIEVFKNIKGDDQKLRTLMTPEQRKAL
jgi:hypothetical protein